MNGAAWAAVAMAALTLAWAITAWMLARSLAAERERGSISTQLATLQRDLDRIAADQGRAQAAIMGQIRDDRRATDNRLRWLETHLWSTGHRG